MSPAQSPTLKRPPARKRTPTRTGKGRAPAAPVALDSSCWLEFFADTERADLYAGPIEHAQDLVVPVLTVYEVAKKLAREVGDDVAAAALSLMQRGTVVSIDLPQGTGGRREWLADGRQPDLRHGAAPRRGVAEAGQPP